MLEWVPWASGAAVALALLARDAFVWNFTIAMVASGAFLTALINLENGLNYVAWNIVALATAVVAGIYVRRIHPKQPATDTLWNLLKNDVRLNK